MLKPYTPHHMTLPIRVGSSPANRNLLLLEAWSQQTRWNRSSHEFARRAFFPTLTNSKPTVSCSATVSAKPGLDDCLTVLALLPLPPEPLIPGFYMPLYVEDPKVLAALQESKSGETPYAGAFLSKDDKDPSPVIHQVGTLAQIISIQGEQVIIIGRGRIQITETVSNDHPLTVKTHHLKDKPYDKDDEVIKATYFEDNIGDSNYRKLAKFLLKKRSKLTDSRAGIFEAIDFNYSKLADFGAGISGANELKLQEVLEELDESTEETTEDETESTSETDEDEKEAETFRKRIEPIKEKIPKHVLKVIEEQFAKFDRIRRNYGSTDDIYDYLDLLTSLPWGKCSDENFDVLRAEKILDEDHYGLRDVKERILEFIAVGTLTGNPNGKIICLSGPPGVGKTSIARSVARALGRKFFRLAVGGLSDSSEIKGDRSVCIGSKPGKMVQCLKQVGTENPLVLLDEIDKLGKCSKYDPEGALLELLDPEQNSHFLDYFLDVTIDLSKVLFVCTANDTDKISGPLIDRMEVIKLAGYTTDEKMHIARDYLVKTVSEKCGIKPEKIDVSDAALLSLIENYCREAGVRNLQKQIEKIFRKIALKLVRQRAKTKKTRGVAEKFMIEETNLADYIGKPVFLGEKIYEQTPVGVVMGLAWTSMGGSTLYIETTFVEESEGKGGLHITGHLGNVMKESAEIAHTVARRIMFDKDPKNLFFPNSKLHLHVPQGATPKDGPSAGCAMITSLLSLAMKKPVRKDLAMTGEVTLTGRILPIGGLKEKTMAARRSQVKVIIFPEANRRDFEDLEESVKEGLNVHFVDVYEQIFELAFGYDQ
ncbi:Lon protease-like protein 3 [Raphanus sativus]|nr:Lon protease-like protein 3 [Raphanus sativus]